MQLRESDRSGDHLAWFSKNRRGLRNPLTGATYLVIKPDMAEMRDMIVLSCLLAEHKRRVLIAEQSLGKTILDVMVVGF